MNKLIAILTTFTLLFNLPLIAHASEVNSNTNNSSNINSEVVDLGDGLTIKYEITEINPYARASTKTVAKTATCVYGGKTVAIIKLTASFSYTGSSATCTSASSSYTMYEGWSYSNRSTTRSGNTATTSAKIKKGLDHTNISVTLTCSKTGAIS